MKRLAKSTGKLSFPPALEQGMALLKGNKLDDALNKFNEIINRDPCSNFKLFALAGRAMLYSKLKKHDLQLADLDFIVRITSNPALFFLKGRVYIINNQWDEALKCFSTVIGKQNIPDNYTCEGALHDFCNDFVKKDIPLESAAQTCKGYIYMKQGKMEQALSDYNVVLSEHPEHALTLGRRAELYIAQNKYSLALNDLKLVLNNCADSEKGIIQTKIDELERKI